MVAQVIAVCIFSYLLGSIPFSYIIAKKVKGIDIRSFCCLDTAQFFSALSLQEEI